MSDGYDGIEGPVESPEEYVSRLTEERRVALENSRQEREIESAIEDLNKLWHTIAIHTFTDKIFALGKRGLTSFRVFGIPIVRPKSGTVNSGKSSKSATLAISLRIPPI